MLGSTGSLGCINSHLTKRRNSSKKTENHVTAAHKERLETPQTVIWGIPQVPQALSVTEQGVGQNRKWRLLHLDSFIGAEAKASKCLCN